MTFDPRNPNSPGPVPGNRSVRNPVPRPGMTVREAMGGGMDVQFNPSTREEIPGHDQVNQADMMRLLSQNVQLNPSAGLPPDQAQAVRQGLRENPDLQGDVTPAGAIPYERGRVDFDGNDPRAPARSYSDAPASRPSNIPPPPTKDDFPALRDPNAPRQNPNDDRRQRPVVPGQLPDHIRQKMAGIDAMRANPDEFRRQQEREALNHSFDDDGLEDVDEENQGFDRMPARDDEPPRVARSPRLPPRQRQREVMTNQPDAPRRQPEVSESERAAIVAARGEATGKQFTPTKPRFVVKKIDKTGEFIRLNLLSGGVFYDGADVQVRKFNLTDAMNIQKAKENQDLTALIDVVGASLSENFDVRDLTVPDFTQIMYWHRFHSYPTIPFILNWTSKYGNRAQYRLTETEIQSKTMEISEEDLQPWLEQGYTVPRVRDMELFNREQFTPEERYLLNRAQFFVGNPRDDGQPPDIQDKIDMMTERCAESLDAVARITEFAQLTEHGIIERVILKDAKFDKQAHVDKLVAQRDMILKSVERLAAQGTDQARQEALVLNLQADELDDDIEKWEQEEGAAAEAEDVVLNIPLLNFFPTV